jgi:hypothetical protein
MDEYLTPPPGWRYAAYPWFAMEEIPELPQLVQVGRVLLPEFFHLVIGAESMWNDRLWKSGDVALFINFQVFNFGYGEELEIVGAKTSYDDLSDTFEKVRKIIPSRKWKPLGVHYMTRYLARFMEEGERPTDDPSPYGVGSSDTYYGQPPRNAMNWIEKLEDRASEAYAAARDQPNPRRKRNRITDDFLKEVAHVYLVAERMGMPPTRDVASHFKAPHSTAAKWVGTARRKGFLPPVTAGGES